MATDAVSKPGQYPDHTLEEAIRDAGISCRCMWEVRGPKNTGIAWIVCYLIDHSICLVQTYKGGGWEAYTPNSSGDIKATVEDVIARCTADRS